MSFLKELQAIEAEYESVVYAPDDTVKYLRELFYSECISTKPTPSRRNKEIHATKQEITDVLDYLKSIDSQRYTARELMEMIDARPELTYQVTPPRIRHLMSEHKLPFRRAYRS